MYTIIIEVDFITAMIICLNKTNYKRLISKITLSNLNLVPRDFSCPTPKPGKRGCKQPVWQWATFKKMQKARRTLQGEKEEGVGKHALTLLHWDLRPLQFSKTKNKDPLWITKTKTLDPLQIWKTKTLKTPSKFQKLRTKTPSDSHKLWHKS